jgi:F1F0 ATPase subunit 2
MNDTLTLFLSGFAGLLLGGLFFGGLWWTVRKGITAKQPALWFLGSMVVRMSIVMVGFYLVSGDHWQRMLACLLGFMSARLIAMRLTLPAPGVSVPRNTVGEAAFDVNARIHKESGHAT